MLYKAYSFSLGNHIILDTLKPQQMHIKDSVWFFDIDDTLVDTAGCTIDGADGVYNIFRNTYSEENALRIKDRFIEIFELILAGYRVMSEEDWAQVPGGKVAFDKLMSKIDSLQIKVKQKFGTTKKWSREVFIKIAADELDIKTTSELIHEAAEAYWLTLTEKIEVFPGTLEFFEFLNKNNLPIYFITSSDARLKMLPDGQFIYVPEYSEELKRHRIELLREKGLNFRLVTIGDPEDKPSVEFFQKGIGLAKQDLKLTEFDFSKAVMIGDSIKGDLETPKDKFHFGLVVLFKKGQASLIKHEESYISTGNLTTIINWLEK